MNELISHIQDTQQLLIQSTKSRFFRFLYKKIDFNEKLIGIIGPRGVGKTTLILQHLKAFSELKKKFLYFSADSVFLKEGDLFQLVKDFYYLEGGRLVAIDEIHRYANWNQELKNIYDSFPDLHIIFSGSSSLNLIQGKYDLSRRGSIYELPGLSFREFLNFEKNLNIKPFTLNTLLKDYEQLSRDLGKDYILMYMKEYFEKGYYPFYAAQKNTNLYYQKINNIIDKTIYEDISSFYKLKTENLYVFKDILSFLATSSPGEINTHKLAKSTKRNYETVAHYLEILQDTCLIRNLSNDKKGHALIRNAKKVFLDNINILQAINYALGKKVSIGTARELFVLKHLQNSGNNPMYSSVGDLQVESTIFEIGGKGKNTSQIKGSKDAYLVLDNIISSSKGKIPLYLMGFLY